MDWCTICFKKKKNSICLFCSGESRGSEKNCPDCGVEMQVNKITSGKLCPKCGLCKKIFPPLILSAEEGEEMQNHKLHHLQNEWKANSPRTRSEKPLFPCKDLQNLQKQKVSFDEIIPEILKYWCVKKWLPQLYQKQNYKLKPSLHRALLLSVKVHQWLGITKKLER